MIKKALEYYENGKDIDIVTGNMEMDAIMLLKEFEKKYPDFVNSLKNRLKSWGGMVLKDLEIWIGMVL
ncbi:MAG: hypothetical protein IPF43_10130 [Arcobacter sp.]|nr:hypothetical protein [Arcobacter sp.]